MVGASRQAQCSVDVCVADYCTLLTWAGLLWACSVPRTNRRQQQAESQRQRIAKMMAQRADAIMPRARQVRRRDPELAGFSRQVATVLHPGNRGQWAMVGIAERRKQTRLAEV